MDQVFGAWNGVKHSYIALGSVDMGDWNLLQLGEFRKVGSVVENLRTRGFDPYEIQVVLRALFLTQSYDDMREAFLLFDSRCGSGQRTIIVDEFRDIIKLMGEDLDQERIDELFEEADADGSGDIDFEEFCDLVKQLNTKDSIMGTNKYLQTSKDFVSSSLGAVTTNVKKGLGVDAINNVMKANGTLHEDLRNQLDMQQLDLAGWVVGRLQQQGMNADQINKVLRALLLVEGVEECFDVFDLDGNGSLDLTEFKGIVPIIAKDVTAEEIDTLFEAADKDGSNALEAAEFRLVIEKLHARITGKDGGVMRFDEELEEELEEEEAVDINALDVPSNWQYDHFGNDLISTHSLLDPEMAATSQFEAEMHINVMILGDRGVGKTYLVQQFSQQQNLANPPSKKHEDSLLLSHHFFLCPIMDNQVLFQLVEVPNWNNNGSTTANRSYMPVAASLMPSMNIFMFVFSLSDEHSLQQAHELFKDCLPHMSKGVESVLYLVGNKTHKYNTNMQVNSKMAEDTFDDERIHYVEIGFEDTMKSSQSMHRMLAMMYSAHIEALEDAGEID